MYNWRLLLLAFTAVIQPIASFTEGKLVDGRQQYCDHRLSKDPGYHLYGNDPVQLPSENRRVSLNRETRRNEPRERNLTPNRLKIDAFVLSRDLTRVSPEFEARSLRTDVRRVRETPDLARRNTQYSDLRAKHVFRESSYKRQSREDRRFIQTRQPSQRHSSEKNEAQRNTVTREIRNEVDRVVDTVRTERSATQNYKQKESNDREANYRSIYAERDMRVKTRFINVQDEPNKKSRNARRVIRDTNSFDSLGSRMDSRLTRDVREGNIERSLSLERRDDERVRNTQFGSKMNFRSAERREGKTFTRRVTVQAVNQERVRSHERMAVVERPLTNKSSISETELREINVDDRTTRSNSRARTTSERRMEQNERWSVTERHEVREKTHRNLNTDNKRIERLRINRKSQDITKEQQHDSARSVTNLRSYDESRLQSNERRTFTNRININKRATQTERRPFNDQTRRSVDDRIIQRVRVSREPREVHSLISRSNDERRQQSRRNNDERQLRSVSNDRGVLTVRSQVNEQKRSTVDSRKAESRANRQARQLSLESRNSDSDRSSLTTRKYDNHRMQAVRNERGIAEQSEAEARQFNSLTIVRNRDEGLRINRRTRDLTRDSRTVDSDRLSSIVRTHEERRLHYVRNEAERSDTERRQWYGQQHFTVDNRRVEGMRSNTRVRDLSQGREIENSDRPSSSARAREVRRLQLVRTDRRVLDEQLVRERNNINDQRRFPVNDRKADRMRIISQSRALSQERRSYDSDISSSDARIYDERRLQSVKSERRMSAEHERATLESERRQVSELRNLGTAGGRDEHISYNIHSRVFSQARRSLYGDRRSSKAKNYEERRVQSRNERAVHAERWPSNKEQRRVKEHNRLGERFERVRISRRSRELTQEREVNEFRRISKDDRERVSVRDSSQLQERQELNSHRRSNYNDEMRTRSNPHRDISNAGYNKHSARQSIMSYGERTQQRVKTVSLERHTKDNRKLTERDHVRTNQRTFEIRKDDTPATTTAVVESRDGFRISDQRMAISRKLSNVELTGKQTIMYSPKSMESYEDTWQYLIYTIHAIYLCSIIMPTLMGQSGNAKNKYTSFGLPLWMPLQKLLKVD